MERVYTSEFRVSACVPVSNGHYGAVLELFPDSLLNQSIGLNIDICRCFI